MASASPAGTAAAASAGTRAWAGQAATLGLRGRHDHGDRVVLADGQRVHQAKRQRADGSLSVHAKQLRETNHVARLDQLRQHLVSLESLDGQDQEHLLDSGLQRDEHEA